MVKELQLDAILLLVGLVYGFIFLVGKSANAKRANAWWVLPNCWYASKFIVEYRLDAHESLFAEQFTRPGERKHDGYSDIFVYSTGRRAVRSLHTVLSMFPRHDLLQILYEFAWSSYDLKYRPEDRVTLDFALDEKSAAQLPDFVWAVVAKDELSSIRDGRWDLVSIGTWLRIAALFIGLYADPHQNFWELITSPNAERDVGCV
jgi:hypothetical protein